MMGVYGEHHTSGRWVFIWDPSPVDSYPIHTHSVDGRPIVQHSHPGDPYEYGPGHEDVEDESGAWIRRPVKASGR